MIIKRLHLENFRGIKELDINLESPVINISGKNGSGKTTVANAISWLLTDQPITGEKDFTPKTEGTHNLNHIAEMTVGTLDGDKTLKKDFHEVWKKKRGSKNPEFAGHETDYYVNGVPVKKKDYEALMETICGGDLKDIIMLTRVGFFAEDMKMESRRKVLFDVCGEMTDADVIKAAGLERLNDFLLIPGTTDQRYSTEEYMAILKSRRKDINKKLDELPARIDELTKTLPEEEAQDHTSEIKELEQKKQDILSLPAENKTAALKAAIAGVRAGMESDREIYLKEANKGNAATLERIRNLQTALADAESKKAAANTEHKQTLDDIAKTKKKREELLAEFEELKTKKWDASQEACPTCGQTLPIDKVNELRHRFLEKLAKEKERINEAGKECSKDKLAELEARQAKIENDIKDHTESIESLQLHIETAKAKLTTPEPFEQTDRFKEAAAKIADLEQKLQQEVIPDKNPELDEIEAKLKELRTAEAASTAAEKTRQRIAELETEKKDLGTELDKVDCHIAAIEEFYRQKVAMVTEKIDSEFETVRFLLFKEQINGGLKEVCEPMIPGKDGLVEYKSANTAAQANAGLEIIKVLSDHYGIYLPVILDRAESVTTPIKMPRHQLIKLTVDAEYNELNVKEEE